MSTKTIAIESGVYARLAAEKRDSESFTKVIARLLTTAEKAHTGQSIADALASLKPLSDQEVQRMFSAIEENRREEAWQDHDLR